MITHRPTPRSGARPAVAWAGAAALVLGFLFGSSAAYAAAPPANTIIGNQASAAYLDPNGASQTATSNLVQTTVQQVGSFTLDTVATTTTTVINTKTGAAGATVYAPHTLTNTGNGTDTFTVSVAAPASPNGFSKVEVFADADGNGLPDSTTPLCTAVPTAACAVPAQTVAGSNGTLRFVVAYSIPTTATTATFTSPVAATVTATAGTPALYAAGNTTAADVDNVSLTTQAAFSATKSVSTPAVAWSFNGGVWPAASASGPRSGSSSCAATTAGAIAPAAGCSYTVYTLNFSNTGAAAGTFAITDSLPAGLTYVPGSAVWSSAPGTALNDAAGANDPTGMDFQATGAGVITAVVASVPANASQTVSFVVLVNSSAAIGTSNTTNIAQYNPLSSPTSTSTTPLGTTSPTNGSAYTVLGTYSIVLGSGAGTASATTSLDTSAGVPNTTANDTQTIASGATGSTIKFPGTVFNNGNASDTVSLTIVAPPANPFPAGTTFAFFAADGLTPLTGANTGPIAAGASFGFVVAATLPSPAVIPTGPFNVIVKGTSGNDASKSETTRDTLTALVGVLVDLTNSAAGNGIAGNTGNGDVGTGPSPQPTTTLSVAAGTGATFPLFVKNNDVNLNTYSLAASQNTTFPGSLPAGWTVKFVAAGGDCTSAAITTVSVPALAGGTPGQTQVVACVTAPVSQAPTTASPIYFQVRSTLPTSTGAIAIDTKYDAVTVTVQVVYSATLTPNNNGSVAPGGSVVYAHTLTNSGTQSCAGPYNITAVLPAADTTAGWTTALYIDVNGDGQIDAGDTLVTGAQAGPLAVGGTQKLLVKVFAPGGAVAGAVDTATVTVTFPAGATGCGSPSATDTSTVITGQIRLVKTQILDAACAGTAVPTSSAPLTAKPGQCIVYQVVATNQGAAPVTSMSINDAVPAFTSLTGATQPSVRCISTGTTPVLTTAANYAATATTVSCGAAATVQPGGSATLTFAVKVNN